MGRDNQQLNVNNDTQVISDISIVAGITQYQRRFFPQYSRTSSISAMVTSGPVSSSSVLFRMSRCSPLRRVPFLLGGFDYSMHVV